MLSMQYSPIIICGDRYRRNPYPTLSETSSTASQHSPSEHSLNYADLPMWEGPNYTSTMKLYMDESRRCVRIGGVIDSMEPTMLCSLVAAMFTVEVLGSMRISNGLFVVALADYERDFPILLQHSERLWMGPWRAILSLTPEHRAMMLDNFASERQVRHEPNGYPLHHATFSEWVSRKPTRCPTALV